MTTYKTAKTSREYKTRWAAVGGIPYDITVPVGSIVSNKTALGYDDDYRRLVGFVLSAGESCDSQNGRTD